MNKLFLSKIKANYKCENCDSKCIVSKTDIGCDKSKYGASKKSWRLANTIAPIPNTSEARRKFLCHGSSSEGNLSLGRSEYRAFSGAWSRIVCVDSWALPTVHLYFGASYF